MACQTGKYRIRKELLSKCSWLSKISLRQQITAVACFFKKWPTHHSQKLEHSKYMRRNILLRLSLLRFIIFEIAITPQKHFKLGMQKILSIVNFLAYFSDAFGRNIKLAIYDSQRLSDKLKKKKNVSKFPV